MFVAETSSFALKFCELKTEKSIVSSAMCVCAGDKNLEMMFMDFEESVTAYCDFVEESRKKKCTLLARFVKICTACAWFECALHDCAFQYMNARLCHVSVMIFYFRNQLWPKIRFNSVGKHWFIIQFCFHCKNKYYLICFCV